MDFKRAKVREIVSGAIARRFRSSGEKWLEPVLLDFQDLDASETFEVPEVTVEEEDVTTATLVESNADKRGVEATGWLLGCQGYYARTLPSKGVKDFRGGRKLERSGKKCY